MTVGVSLPDAPASIAGRQVFSAVGVRFTVADLARRAGVGDCEAPFAASTAAVAEEHFRRSRGLLQADQLEAWLTSWEIGADDFRHWCRDVAEQTETATRWCAFVCSEGLDRVTGFLISAVAAACELGEPPQDASAFDPAGWTERLLTATATTETLEAAVRTHRLDWTFLYLTRATAGSRAVAEELRHQVLSDGVDLGAAADLAACPVRDEAAIVAEVLPAALRADLAGARTGELVGPVPIESGWVVIEIRNRVAPNLDDPATRSRAEASVREGAILRAVSRHVVA